MTDYSKGKIYQITDVNYTKCYVGSTCQALSQRLAKHKFNFKDYQAQKYGFTTSFLLFEEFGLENCKIELLEEFPCENKNQLNKKEGEYIRRLTCVNKKILTRTQKEYKNDNKEHFQEQSKKYRQNNIDKIKERDKIYRTNNSEKLSEKKQAYRNDHKEELNEKAKQYYNENRGDVLSKAKLFRENNRERLNEIKREVGKQRTICPLCSCEVRRDGLKKHQQTPKCHSFRETV